MKRAGTAAKDYCETWVYARRHSSTDRHEDTSTDSGTQGEGGGSKLIRDMKRATNESACELRCERGAQQNTCAMKKRVRWQDSVVERAQVLHAYEETIRVTQQEINQAIVIQSVYVTRQLLISF